MPPNAYVPDIDFGMPKPGRYCKYQIVVIPYVNMITLFTQ